MGCLPCAPERRRINPHDVNAVEKILAESSIGHNFQVLVCGEDQRAGRLGCAFPAQKTFCHVFVGSSSLSILLWSTPRQQLHC